MRQPEDSFEFIVAGIHQEGRSEVIRERVREGGDLELIRDRANRFTATAVQVACQGRVIGFVPAEYAVDLAPRMDRGATCQAHVKKILIRGPLLIPVVKVYLFPADNKQQTAPQSEQSAPATAALASNSAAPIENHASASHAADIHAAASRLSEATSRLRSRRRWRRVAQLRAGYLGVVQRARTFFDRMYELRPVVAFSAPLAAAATGLIVSHALGLPIPLVVTATLLATVLGTVLVLNLLYLPSRQVIGDWHAEATEQARVLGDEVDALIAVTAGLERELDILKREAAPSA